MLIINRVLHRTLVCTSFPLARLTALLGLVLFIPACSDNACSPIAVNKNSPEIVAVVGERMISVDDFSHNVQRQMGFSADSQKLAYEITITASAIQV